MSDFNEFNKHIDIVKKGFVTLRKPIKYHNTSVILRDTLLIAPAGTKSLSGIAKLYNLNKPELTQQELMNMDKLLPVGRPRRVEENKSKFMEYALGDSLITLCHATWMERFNFSIGGVGIPLTLSSVSNKYVLEEWSKEGYSGYQVNPDILIGDATRIQTPIGLNSRGFAEVGEYLSMFIKIYKGGRNESLMYGVDQDSKWYDLDLIGAYTTVFSNIGHPSYQNAREISIDELNNMKPVEILNSFLIIECNFNFPESVKFPSIPVYADETTTVYPKMGKSLLTGAEYILAKNQGCLIDIKRIFNIPFAEKILLDENGDPILDKKGKNQYETIRPFKNIINKLHTCGQKEENILKVVHLILCTKK